MVVGEKASWQLKIFKMVFWLIRLFTGKRMPDVIRMRREMDFGARTFLRRPDQVSYQPINMGGLPAERITPDGARHDKILYYLHGGAYALCSLNTHRRMVALLAKEAGATAYAIEYRMAPEHIFPAALIDAVKGYEWLLGQGFKPEDIIIAGDSAGGGLSVSTMLKLREEGTPLPAAAVLLSPWADLEGSGESNKRPQRRDSVLHNEGLTWHGKLYAGDNDLRNPFISPIYADCSHLPPMMIQVGQLELIYNDSTRMAENVSAAGVDVELVEWGHTFHVWQIYDFMLPEARQSIKEIGAYMRKHLGLN
ncbi:alpha/beta hydrolase [soil metagenome]